MFFTFSKHRFESQLQVTMLSQEILSCLLETDPSNGSQWWTCMGWVDLGWRKQHIEKSWVESFRKMSLLDWIIFSHSTNVEAEPEVGLNYMLKYVEIIYMFGAFLPLNFEGKRWLLIQVQSMVKHVRPVPFLNHQRCHQPCIGWKTEGLFKATTKSALPFFLLDCSFIPFFTWLLRYCSFLFLTVPLRFLVLYLAVFAFFLPCAAKEVFFVDPSPFHPGLRQCSAMSYWAVGESRSTRGTSGALVVCTSVGEISIVCPRLCAWISTQILNHIESIQKV